MARIFLALSILAFALVVANAVLAFVLGDFGTASRRYSAARGELDSVRAATDTRSGDFGSRLHRMEELGLELKEQREKLWPHVWLGIVASLIVLLVNSISITYFIGTNRWFREVAYAYSMEREPVDRSQSLKRSSFFWSMTGIMWMLAIAGLGAAADPFAGTADPAAWVTWHWMVGLSGVFVIAASFYAQFRLVAANHELIDQVLARAEHIRSERAALPARST